MDSMQLTYFLLLVVTFLGCLLASPVNEDPAAAATLDDVADLGGQEAMEGDRPARWLDGGWGSGWNGGWNRGWSISYSPWRSSYSNYWW
ncbi:uncharacterized protein LOC26534485 [Drosophila yakuba]|uniref:Uncharacterized protein n=1 Tax=Drosophila yakuba TaxID=7245 RepID=A0A0R1DNJ8_DROYA|nr:uncharacterized protein LOC26534485 [Drosophila yakuba]KRJ98874.1 uncharacterized protein Dyak_GE27304 [Drosophila yakuba]